jgi:hypothetical protein
LSANLLTAIIAIYEKIQGFEMRLVQFESKDGQRKVGVPDGGSLRVVEAAERVYDLALQATRNGGGLEALVDSRLGGETEDYGAAISDGRILTPIDHPDPAHCLVSGTGLSHLGSAQARDEMHAKLSSGESLTDSMKMFQSGLEGGKPASGSIGAEPEWFWKGDGSTMVASGQPLNSPGFALDGGEEAEIAGLYIIGDDGTPFRMGFALANEFSDHVLERQNYLLLAHSKLRPCALGPELRLGALPPSVTGMVRVRRGNEEVWSGELLSGEDNMSHSIGNLEHHHFRYPLFRRPGDVHVHFFGAGVLSVTAGIVPKDGDVFEIESPEFGRPLSNPLSMASDNPLVEVAML